MQDQWAVSSNHERMHCSAGYMHYDTDRRGHRFGINRKAFKVSGHGVFVDGTHVGKPEVL